MKMLVPCSLLAMLAGGCALGPPELAHPPEEIAARAVGLEGAFVFYIEGVRDEPGPLTAGERLTIDAAIRRAVTTSPAVQAALARVRVAQAEAWQERLLPNPIVSVVFRFPEGGGQPTIEAGLAGEFLSLLRQPARAKAADARYRAAAAEAVSTVLHAVAEVEGGYAEVQALEASAPYLQRRRELVSRVLELERSRFEGGETARLDLVTLQAQEVELQAEVDDLLLEQRQAKQALATLMGDPRSDLSWTVAVWKAPPYNSVNESVWIEAALEHRPEAQQRLFELEALGVDAELARTWLLDEIEVGVEAEHEGSAWSVGPGVGVPLPIFDWGQARTAQVEAQRLEAAQTLVQVKRQIISDVRQAAAAFNQSVRRLDRVRKTLVPLAEQRAELAEQAFRAGQSDASNLLLAEQDLAQARQRLVELEQRTAQALAELHRAVGGPGNSTALIERQPAAVSSDIQPIEPPNAVQPNSPVETGQPQGEQR